jgi:hypothetical protein
VARGWVNGSGIGVGTGGGLVGGALSWLGSGWGCWWVVLV